MNPYGKHKTCIVRQENKGLHPVRYWLHVSSVFEPPTNGFQLTRQELKLLHLQIEMILEGTHSSAGHVYGVNRKHKTVLMRNYRRRIT